MEVINYGTYLIGLLCRFSAISYIKHLTKDLEHSNHSVLKYNILYCLIGVTIPIIKCCDYQGYNWQCKKMAKWQSRRSLGWGNMHMIP